MSSLITAVVFPKTVGWTVIKSPFFIIGFLFSLAIGLRGNVLPATIIFIFYALYNNLKDGNFKNVFCLVLGLSTILIIPYHNFLFTGEFIPLTIAAYKDWNLGATPGDYYQLIVSILSFNFNFELWNKIILHINGELKLYEIWYHISILSCFFILFNKKTPLIVKCFAISALSMLVMLLFYHQWLMR